MSNKNSHLTLNDRIIIETGISNGSQKTAIAATLGKDKSTIGKEIKLHRHRSYSCCYPSDCSLFSKCKHKKTCNPTYCQEYIPFKCSRRDRSPGACNGCTKYNHCRYDKYRYDAKSADKEYRDSLVDSRLGADLTYNEAKALAEVVKPLLDQGQSPFQIITNHPELGICEKTLYNYIEDNILSQFGINNLSLRIKTKRKISKKKTDLYKKREDRNFLKGRTYKDYKVYTSDNPSLYVMEMDTVYNDVSNGPFIQTFEFIEFGFTFGILHTSKTAQDMVNGIDLLETILGPALFRKYAAITLTDRGSEFVYADAFEKVENGVYRTRIFYCDPMQSGQKGALENSHRELRYICPKEIDLYKLGLKNQEDLNLVFSHVNSSPHESLRGKTPIEMMKFIAPELYDKFKEFGIVEIEKDKVILKPYLLKK